MSVERHALNFLSGLQAQAEAEDWETAEAFVAITTSPDQPGTVWGVNGPFPDALTALTWAEEHQHALNGDEPQPDPFEVRVHPCRTPEDP